MVCEWCAGPSIRRRPFRVRLWDGEGALAWSFRDGELNDSVFRTEADGKEFEVTHVGSGDGRNSGGGRIEDEDRSLRKLGEALFKYDGLADSGAVADVEWDACMDYPAAIGIPEALYFSSRGAKRPVRGLSSLVAKRTH